MRQPEKRLTVEQAPLVFAAAEEMIGITLARWCPHAKDPNKRLSEYLAADDIRCSLEDMRRAFDRMRQALDEPRATDEMIAS